MYAFLEGTFRDVDWRGVILQQEKEIQTKIKYRKKNFKKSIACYFIQYTVKIDAMPCFY